MAFGIKEILFGIAGVSMIIWVALIGLWHTYMFPRFFEASKEKNLASINRDLNTDSSTPNQIRPVSGDMIGLGDRGVYSKKSLVIADFNRVDSTYSTDRLYTTFLLGLGVVSFVLITYGLHSGFYLI